MSVYTGRVHRRSDIDGPHHPPPPQGGPVTPHQGKMLLLLLPLWYISLIIIAVCKIHLINGNYSKYILIWLPFSSGVAMKGAIGIGSCKHNIPNIDNILIVEYIWFNEKHNRNIGYHIYHFNGKCSHRCSFLWHISNKLWCWCVSKM